MSKAVKKPPVLGGTKGINANASSIDIDKKKVVAAKGRSSSPSPTPTNKAAPSTTTSSSSTTSKSKLKPRTSSSSSPASTATVSRVNSRSVTPTSKSIPTVKVKPVQSSEMANDAISVYELKLEEDGSPSQEKKYIRLPAPVKPYVLRFTIDAGSSASKDGSLWTNFPAQGKNYERNTFVERKLPTSFSQPIKVDLLIQQAGAFEFYVEHSAPDEAIPYPTISKPIHLVDPSSRKRVQSTHGYFNVDPILTIPTRSRILSSEDSPLPIGKGGSVSKETQILSQDGIVLQSFIAKWAGSLSEWSTYLDSASNSGYNMLHFPPLQVRGDSNSPYSIADQLDFSKDLFDSKAGKSKTLAERKETMKNWIDNIKNKWGILSMTDVVWNHTANNSEWLNEHPDAAYNPVNSPHLTPAEELDRALISFSSRLEELGLPVDPKTSSDVSAIMEGVKTNVFSELKLWQYYVLDVAAHKEEFAKTSSTASSKKQINSVGEDDLRNATLEQAPALLEKYALRNRMTLGDRFTTHLDIPLSLSICQTLGQGKSKEEIQQAFEKALDVINAPLYQTYDDDVKAALENLGGRLKYMRIEEGGPKMGKITKSSPLCEPYFTRLDPSHPAAKKHDPRKLALANNGWIWAADPLSDFASSKSRVYLRREVIAWGDCVKLRYGSKPSDNPFLWKHMEEYTTSLAKIFAGFRIDNCHSTPIHVGEYFLDAARRINPNLYVCAELFTGSAEMDVHFVSKLGINSLIREMENGHDPKEESRLLYRFGVNKPIGSMDTDCLSVPGKVTLPGSKTSSPCTVIPLQGSSPHALFMDVTHDNETPTLKRTTEDAITMGALVAFSWSAIGSTKGFDDLYPHLLNVVTETRKYEKDTQDKGINEVKRVFNHLHEEMVRDGYSEGHVHQENDYIMLHRVHPQTHKGYLCLAHTAFNDRGKARGEINPFKLNRTKAKFIFGKSLEITSRSIPEDKTTLRGLPSKLIDIPAPSMKEGEDHDGFFTEITVPENFPPGSVMLFSTYMDGLGSELETLCTSGATEAMSKLSLVDLNVMLHRADGEEKDVTDGADGTYTIPEYGQLVYCGLEGWMAPLRHVMNHNDLGHPVCAHLRAGTWALDYVHDRLKRQFKIFPNLEKPADWLKERFDAIKSTVPSFMRPKYFALVINEAYMAARQRAISQMSSFVTEGHDFTQSLALCAVQMNGMVKSASLWPDKDSASMAAGLPFFSASWARMWGRDVFISLRGLYLTTGMYAAAREHILSFGCTLKHGLIPNLLDSTRTPRYNCRDGPWYFAQNVQDYVNMVPGGESILSEKVPRRFPLDDEWVPWDDPKAFKHVSTVAELIQEILQRHATGIHFREYNAGPNIDQHMKDEGFNIDIDVDWKTGLVMGGNAWNCGTWQDKNGSSTKAGNVGVPGSPRDGAAVEITGLLKSTLSWVDSLSKKGKWTEKGVTATIDGKKTQVSYKQWADLIQASFEKCYYVPLDPAEDSKYFVDTKLVNRRGIYKDVYGSGKGREWSDYQLRANYPIAMCVAPELFDPKRGLSSLQVVANVLRGPLGMRTLDPSDMNYRGDYDNSNDTTDFHLAQGWNYHNGPEWVFPTGFFLRAYLIFDTLSNGAGSGSGSTKGDINESFHLLSSMLLEHRKHIKTSPWAGLPELTNTNGKDCPDSCKTQAWSASTLLDLLQEMRVRESGSTQKVNGK